MHRMSYEDIENNEQSMGGVPYYNTTGHQYDPLASANIPYPDVLANIAPVYAATTNDAQYTDLTSPTLDQFSNEAQSAVFDTSRRPSLISLSPSSQYNEFPAASIASLDSISLIPTIPLPAEPSSWPVMQESSIMDEMAFLQSPQIAQPTPTHWKRLAHKQVDERSPDKQHQRRATLASLPAVTTTFQPSHKMHRSLHLPSTEASLPSYHTNFPWHNSDDEAEPSTAYSATPSLFDSGLLSSAISNPDYNTPKAGLDMNSHGGIRIARLPVKKPPVEYIIPDEISDMTVSQMKSELKRRGLPAIGRKCQLQERLSAYLER